MKIEKRIRVKWFYYYYNDSKTSNQTYHNEQKGFWLINSIYED